MIDRSAPILLVEPRATSFTIISDLLHGVGFENVEAAVDGTTALEVLGSRGPLLVIADLHIGPTNGLQFVPHPAAA